MRIASGVTDQVINFVAVDATDLKTRETGLTTFTVYRCRNGGTPAAMTTPTVTEADATNLPGVYELLLDEDMTIGAGNLTEEIVYHITQASMAPVTRSIELFAPANYTIGTVTTLTDHTAQTGDTYALANGATGFAAIDTVVDGIQTDLSNGVDGLGAIKAETALIVADTNELQTNQGSWATATGFATETKQDAQDAIITEARLAELDAANLPTDVAAVKSDTAGIQTDLSNGTDGLGALKTLIDALNDISTAEVNAEVVDALNTDTYAEPGQGAPAATATLAAKINYLYKAWRNKTTQTATTLSLYDDAGSTVDQKSTVSDDTTTATRGEIVTGP